MGCIEILNQDSGYSCVRTLTTHCTNLNYSKLSGSLGDPLEIAEYFYGYRKKWKDCEYRILSNQFSHYTERMAYWQARSDL